MKIVYSKEESLEEYMTRMSVQDEQYRKFAIRQRRIRKIIQLSIIAVGLIVVFVIIAMMNS